jgi:CDGSH-type Zn-finger protein
MGESNDEPTNIVAIDNGPLRVSGSFALKDAQGQEFDLTGRPAISLCRCGASANKPFCDGAHKGAGFESSVKAK